MKGPGGTTSTFAGLLALVLFYLVLVGLILVFSRQIVSDANVIGSPIGVATAVVTLILPVVLVGAIAVNLVRLIRDRSRRKAGARLKTRLILFFTFVAVLALIPQAVLSATFINSVLGFWVGAGMGDALEAGLSISLAYHTDKVRNLSRFAASPLLDELLEPVARDPEQAWRRLTEANPEISVVQIFDGDGRELLFRGEPAVRADYGNILRDPPGSPVRHSRQDVTLLRVVVPPSPRRAQTVVLGIVYPRRFDEMASGITSSRRLFKELARYQDVFRTALIAFYFFFSFPILLLAILVSFLLTEDIIRPIVHLEEATRRVADGDFSFRLLARGGDELSLLVDSFNRMIAELETSRRKLLQAEKIAAWKEIAQRLAHEIRNPLTPIKLSAQRILKHAGAEDVQAVIEPAAAAIIKEVDNLNRLLVEFREFTRLPDPRPQPVAIGPLLEEVLSVYRNLSQKVSFECRDLAPVRIPADREQIKRVFANLIRNAVQAMPDGGVVTITADLVTKDQTGYLRIRVQDTGGGMEDEARERAFEPYYTTKRDGSGLGLPIVERIIFDHNGSISFESRRGSGTTFTIDLPVGGE